MTWLPEPTVRHVRKSDASVTDRRHRCRVKYANKARPTFCGAEPSIVDVSRRDALHLLRPDIVRLKPEWSADICETCKQAVSP